MLVDFFYVFKMIFRQFGEDGEGGRGAEGNAHKGKK